MSMTIRRARTEDAPALHTLELLDDHALPAGDTLVAEEDGAPVAAVHVATGTAVADPFRRSAAPVALLRLRAAQLRGEDTPLPRRRLRRGGRAATAALN
jgi:hypothetical protein